MKKKFKNLKSENFQVLKSYQLLKIRGGGEVVDHGPGIGGKNPK
jgi:hypothetical protein